MDDMNDSLIIDPPYLDPEDLPAVERWIEELHGLAAMGYDVKVHLVEAETFLAKHNGG